MKLEEIRRRIDKIDRELLVILQERMGLALRSNKFKETVSDPEREKSMFARIERRVLLKATAADYYHGKQTPPERRSSPGGFSRRARRLRGGGSPPAGSRGG
ncbi:MAG: chorismate mutase, partial [Deltaproteobacteria bacterium]|nr:chorismate mutase [Deltaproteobacteria bacterium]